MNELMNKCNKKLANQSINSDHICTRHSRLWGKLQNLLFYSRNEQSHEI